MVTKDMALLNKHIIQVLNRHLWNVKIELSVSQFVCEAVSNGEERIRNSIVSLFKKGFIKLFSTDLILIFLPVH